MTSTARLSQRSSHRSAGRRFDKADPTDRIAVVLDKTGQLCLAVIILAVPLTTATFRELGIGIFVTCSLLMGLTWAIQHILRPSSASPWCGAEFIIFAALALVCLQLIRFSPAVLSTVAPFSGVYLPLWGSPEGAFLGGSPWQTISLTPSLTRSGLVLLLGYSVFFLTLVQRLRTPDDIDHVLRLIAGSCGLMAVIALGQLFLGNGQYLWMFEHPNRTPSWPAKGTFTNQNHFAHFLALGIGPLIWCWHCYSPKPMETVDRGSLRTRGFGLSHTSDGPHQKLIGAAIAVVLFAGILSLSRGGILAVLMATSLAVAAFASQWKKLLKFSVPILIFVSLGLTVFGAEAFQSRWQSVVNADSVTDLSVGRFALWSALADAIPNFWAAGSGLGSHAEVYPTWMEQDFGVRFSHAESGYLQILLELGIPGIVLLLTSLSLIVRWGWVSLRSGDQTKRRRAIILMAGLLVSVLHSVVDFVWYIPACMILTLTTAACLCRCSQLQQAGSREDVTAVRWPAALAWMLILLAVPVGKLSADIVSRDAGSEPEWFAFRKQKSDSGNQTSYESLQTLDQRLDVIIRHLENCIRIDPSDCGAKSDLAAMYLRRFEHEQIAAENPMTIQEIRSTVHTSDFESTKAISEWLFRAFGDNSADLYRALFMGRQALNGQPLRGETYLVIAQVGFLSGLSTVEEDALIQQAIILRPHEASVLYVAGLSRAERGDIDGACQQLSQAFRLSPAVRPLIVRTLGPLMSVSEFLQKIAPGDDGLFLLHRHYIETQRTDDQQTVAAEFARRHEEFAANRSPKDFQFWPRSAELLEAAGQDTQALACRAKAVEQSPENYKLRLDLALSLVDNGQTKAGLAQLKWCQLRHPDDAKVALKIQQTTVALASEVQREQ